MRSASSAARASARPASISGSSTFSITDSAGSNWNDWKMNPTFSRRSRVSPASSSGRLDPIYVTVPDVGKSIAPARFSSVTCRIRCVPPAPTILLPGIRAKRLAAL